MAPFRPARFSCFFSFAFLRPFCALLCLTLTLFLTGATYIVPDYTDTIQAAIDSAATGDTVLVREGTYVENLQILGKALTLRALGTPETTIIDGNQMGSVIEVTGDVHIEGFTIQNGLDEDGGGIRAIGPLTSSITVVLISNIIRANRAGYAIDDGSGGGLLIDNSADCLVTGNIIRDNYAGDSGGGLSLSGVDAQITENVMSGNGCHVGGGAIHLDFYYPGTSISGNVIFRNWSDNFGGAIDNSYLIAGGNAVDISGNTIVGNYINNMTYAQGAGLSLAGVQATVESNIVALNHGPFGRNTGVGIDCSSGDGGIILRCNAVWGNDLDYDLFGCDTTGLGNFSLDPKFCDPNRDDFSLASDSPCREDSPAACGLVGALGIGCQQTPVVPVSWGRLKTLYGSLRGGYQR